MIVFMVSSPVELEHSLQLVTGFASASEKSSKLSSMIPPQLVRGASFTRLIATLLLTVNPVKDQGGGAKEETPAPRIDPSTGGATAILGHR
jgi:hypothetical protein